jgi:hemoglobin-like flavoprotein
MLGMTPDQIALVEQSLTSLAPVIDDVVADFYAALFAADPAVRSLFAEAVADADSFGRLRAKFADQLADVLTAVRDHPRFLATAGDLGARHVRHGVTAAHYELVGRVLLEVLAAHHGADWTPARADAWRLAYNLTAEVMMAGAGPHAGRPRG